MTATRFEALLRAALGDCIPTEGDCAPTMESEEECGSVVMLSVSNSSDTSLPQTRRACTGSFCGERFLLISVRYVGLGSLNRQKNQPPKKIKLIKNKQQED